MVSISNDMVFHSPDITAVERAEASRVATSAIPEALLVFASNINHALVLMFIVSLILMGANHQ